MKCKIYYTSDTHGFLFPTNYQNSDVVNMGLLGAVGGFNKDENTLVIDGGDTIQGSPFIKVSHQYIKDNPSTPHPIATVLNYGGYDYITLGNHDFNYGYDQLNSYLTQLDAKCVVANVTDKTSTLPIQPYDIKTLGNGLKIGLVGIVTEYVKIWEQPAHIEKIIIDDPLEKAREALAAIKDKCDITICIYHGGFEADLATGEILATTKENIGYKICKELDFDIMLSAHQHMPVPVTELFGTYAVQLAHNTVKYFELDIEYDDGKITCTGEAVQVSADNVPKQLCDQLSPIEQKVQEKLGTPAGGFSEEILPLPKLELGVNGSRLADFCNQLQLEVTGAEISCTSLTNIIIGFPKEISIQDIIAAFPFSNTILVLEVTPTVLKNVLERCGEYFHINDNGQIEIADCFLRPKIEHYNFDFFAGISYTLDITKPVGQRVTRILFKGQPLEDRTYTLAMNNYRANGTGGYDDYKNCPVLKDDGRDIQELMIDYVTSKGVVQLMEKPDYKVLY